MSKNITILICMFLWFLPCGSLVAQTKGDSVEYVKVNNELIHFKKANSREIIFKFKGAELKKLLSEPWFVYSREHHVTTRNGFLLGWYFKFDDYWMINIYFDRKNLEESDNVYLNDINLDSVVNKKIRRIDLVKERF